jgi:uncharacterized membrane protein
VIAATAVPRQGGEQHQQGHSNAFRVTVAAVALAAFCILGFGAFTAADRFDAGFWAWLLASMILGIVVVAVTLVVNWDLFRPRRDLEHS